MVLHTPVKPRPLAAIKPHRECGGRGSIFHDIEYARRAVVECFRCGARGAYRYFSRYAPEDGSDAAEHAAVEAWNNDN